MKLFVVRFMVSFSKVVFGNRISNGCIEIGSVRYVIYGSMVRGIRLVFVWW